MATKGGMLVLFCVALCFRLLGAREAVEGREFMIAFMQHNAHESYAPLEQNIFLYISNPGSQRVNVRVEFYDLDTQPAIDVDIDPEATQTVTLNETLMLQGATKHGKSVHVTSDDVIQVQAIYELSQQRKSYGGTGVLPMTSLTKHYLAATHCERRYCVLLVLATQDGAEVKVKLRVGPGNDGGEQPQYNNNTYEDGDEITESLNRGESMQVLCYRCDLTGSWINSSKVVAVFSGGDFTRLSGMSKRDMVVEQMIPITSIGRHYVLGSYFDPPTGEIVKLVPLESGVRFFYAGSCYTSTRERQVFSFERQSDVIAEVKAEGQILVAQFVRGDNFTATPDSVMNLPVPVSQWASSYRVHVPQPDNNDPDDSVHLCLLMPSETFSKLTYSIATRSNPFVRRGDYVLQTLELGASKLLELACSPVCPPFTGHLVRSKDGRTLSITLRDQITDFTPQASDAEEVKEACGTNLTTQSPTTTPQDTTQPPTTTPQDTTQPPTNTPQDTTQPPTTTPQDATQPPTTTPQDTTMPPTTTPQDTTQPYVTTTPQDTTQPYVTTTADFSKASDITTQTADIYDASTKRETTSNDDITTTETDVSVSTQSEIPLTNRLTPEAVVTLQNDVTSRSSITSGGEASTIIDVTTVNDVTTEHTVTTDSDTGTETIVNTHTESTTERKVSTEPETTTTLELTTTKNDVTSESTVTTSSTSAITEASDVTTQHTDPEGETTMTTNPVSADTDRDVTTVNNDVTSTKNDVTTKENDANVLPPKNPVTPVSVPFRARSCECRCAFNGVDVINVNVSDSEKEKIAEQAQAAIRRDLTADKKKFSSYKRKKESSQDDRVSSKMVGTVGISLFVIVFGLIFVSDVISLVVNVKASCKRYLKER